MPTFTPSFEPTPDLTSLVRARLEHAQAQIRHFSDVEAECQQWLEEHS